MRTRPRRFRRACYLLIVAGWLAASSLAPLADGFHLPNFYEYTVESSWTKLKDDFKFPPLPEGKKWSDAYPLFPIDSRVRPYQTLRPGMAHDLVLKSVVKKMIVIFKYTDPYNYAYDSPPWMKTETGREQAVKEALAVLDEIGPQAAAYLWEALEEVLRFENDPRRPGIQEFRSAQHAAAFATEALRDAMRRKEPRWIAIELEIEKEVTAFWKSGNYLGSQAGKSNGKYASLLEEMDKLVRSTAQKDPEIRKLKEAEEDATRKAVQFKAKAPGDYINITNDGGEGGLRIADDYVTRLKDALLRYGPALDGFLKNHLHHRHPLLRQAAEELLAKIEAKTKQEAGK